MPNCAAVRRLARSAWLTAALALTSTACGGSLPAAAHSPFVQTPIVSSAPVPSPVAKQLPDNLCGAVDVPTINSELGLNVKPGVWDGTVCTWVSTNPAGGFTLGRLPESQAASLLASGQAAGGTQVAGLGVAAVVTVSTGVPAPLPPAQAYVFVDLGTALVTMHISGPTVTLDQATELAHDVLG